MRKILPTLLTSAILLTAGVALAQSADTSSASSTSPYPPVIFPIPDLGNCASKDECKAYCSDTAHTSACISFAEAHGMMRSDEIKKARDLIKLKGPGGCTGLACKIYCADPLHADECLAFAKTNHLISDGDAKLMEDIRSNGGPGGCKSSSECRAFCSDPVNRTTCEQFAKDHNIPPPRPMQMRGASSTTPREGGNDKIAEILATKPGPGGCTAVQTCKAYCSDTTHITECVQFAKENGLMTNTEAEQARKFEKPGPGGCLGEACKTYCSDTTHQDECRAFALQNGFKIADGGLPGQGRGENGSSTRMGPPTGTPGMMRGPGGCKNREECEAFCKANPDQCRQPGQGPLGPGNGQGTSSQSGNLRPAIRTADPADMQKPPMPIQGEDIQAQIKARCAQFGGTWDGQRCIKTTTDGTMQPPQPQLIEAEIQKKCESLGGTWDGQRCTKPNMTPGAMQQRPPLPPRPEQSEPTSMTPLSMFTASVFSIFRDLLR